MKKKFIIGGIVAVVVITAIVAVLLFTGKKVTISFDTDGGSPVSAIKVKKGESITLPNTQKEDFNLDGWFLNDVRVTEKTTYDKDTTLKAKWISKTAETFTVTFDSDGGSKVDSIIVECGKELSLPTNPTKKGYNFLSWIDRNGTPIYDKALLSCNDITLTANWEKEETKTEVDKTKTYTCPNGYKLNGTKCTITTAATDDCPSGYSWSTKVSKCVVQTATVPGDCPSGYKWSEKISKCYVTTDKIEGCSVEGYGKIGNGECGKQPVNPSAQNNKELCEHYGMKLGKNGYCYSDVMSTEYVCPSGYTATTYGGLGLMPPKQPTCVKKTDREAACPSGYKLYHSDPNFGIGDRCVKLTTKTKTCPSDYTLSGDNCTKTINATVK